MKQLTYIFCILLMLNSACHTHSKRSSYVIPKIHLALDIPNELAIIDSIPLKGQVTDSTESLLRIESGKDNFLLFRYTPCIAPCELSEAPPITLGFFSDDTGKPKIDTSTTTEFIDSLAFHAFRTQVKYQKRPAVELVSYTRSFNNYLLSINLVYADSVIGRQLVLILRSGKFTN